MTRFSTARFGFALGVALLAPMSPSWAAGAGGAASLDDAAKSLAGLVSCVRGPASPGGPAPKISPEVHATYCRQLRAHANRYLKRYQQHILPVLSEVVPAEQNLPVVYPFGGGDLLTALGTYPNAREITTLSLESAGDIRQALRVPPEELEEALMQTGDNLRRLLSAEHSKTTNLSNMARGLLPAEIGFSLFAISLWNFEVVGLRYFDLNAEGGLVYLDPQELEGRQRKAAAKEGSRAQLYPHVEIGYRRPGETDVRVFRHIGANLADAILRKDGRVLAHLNAKGPVLAMTKAASYLLWWDGFSLVRDYLAKNAVFMISDSTGLPPDVARENGLSQTTYGWFAGPFLPGANKRIAQAFAQEWRSQPTRPIRFHYGYPDALGRGHMLVTRRETTAR